MGAHRRKWLLVVLGACVVIALGTMQYALSLDHWGNLIYLFRGTVYACIVIGLVAIAMLVTDVVRARRR